MANYQDCRDCWNAEDRKDGKCKKGYGKYDDPKRDPEYCKSFDPR